jgi:hypothetical protein
VALNRRPTDSGTIPFIRRPLSIAVESGRDGKPAKRPAGDGIRHELVARIRREIEAGTYDTEERWRLAEERLLQHSETIS